MDPEDFAEFTLREQRHAEGTEQQQYRASSLEPTAFVKKKH
jgi:hypothetical protein